MEPKIIHNHVPLQIITNHTVQAQPTIGVQVMDHQDRTGLRRLVEDLILTEAVILAPAVVTAVEAAVRILPGVLAVAHTQVAAAAVAEVAEVVLQGVEAHRQDVVNPNF